jgi:site-specific recombinase XerC
MEKLKTQLLNGCSRTKFSVYPTNWHTKKASISKDWYVWYRYTDPLYKDLYPHGKLEPVRGMNHIKNREERQIATRQILQELYRLIDHHNYNPITKRINLPNNRTDIVVDEILPETPFIDALRAAKKRLKYIQHTLNDVGYVIDGTEEAAKALGYDKLFISAISRKHIVRIFEQCASKNDRFSTNRQNSYRSYLLALFKILLKQEAVTHNPITGIDKEATIKDEPEMLTKKEREKIDKHLRERNYNFWRYMQIFFHSGGRTTELLSLTEQHVDVAQQRYKTLIRKRKSSAWVWRPIKDIALPLWMEIQREIQVKHEKFPTINKELYFFGEGLIPNWDSIRPDQITKRWRYWVQSDESPGLGIKKGFYKIKHLNATEVMDALTNEISIEDAEKEVAEMNAHTSTEMLQQVYDTKNKIRKLDRIKRVRNTFA